jgi:tetratricopeptide (TPR) repeat protein
MTLGPGGGTALGATMGAATISVPPTDGAATVTGLDAPAPPKGPLRVGQSLGPRYHIIKLLGVGGMGAVYQAWDAELGVAVALKVIRVDEQRAASSSAEKQFKQELLLARQVTHKNVVRIHDLGEIDGIKYITMPYVQGRDLATVLREGGRLPIAQALPLAREIAGGLQAAHEAGVVHRDLKPPNIMISGPDDGRHALIMDFGISASADAAASDTVVGTLEYMAPEQVKGIADARTDVYAFGLIVYEMLTGLRIIADTTPRGRVDAMKHRIAAGLAPVRTLDAAIPDPLAALVTKCLATDPAARFANAAEVNAALAGLDDTGHRIRVAARLTKKIAAAAAVVVAILVTSAFYTAKRLSAPVKPHDPVTVVIADFLNKTGDAAFDHTLEQTLRRALESAGFITAYDRTRIRPVFGVRPPDMLDARAAQELAVKQGLGVVIAGSIDPLGKSYEIAVRATQALNSKEIAAVKARASSKEQVLPTATSLVTKIRRALGDNTSESAQLLAMRSISTTSLDVASHYAAGLEAQSKGKYEEALENFSTAVSQDPKFGLGYQALATTSRNLGRLQDAQKYSTEGLRYLSGMTEREQLAVRASYYIRVGDYQSCVKEYGELIVRYPADAVAHNQRALCLSKLRNFPQALSEMNRAVQILPKHIVLRGNLALYADYAGDFQTAEKEVRAIPEPEAYGTLALAYSQLGQGLMSQAVMTYEKLATQGALGASFASSGLGHVAVYEGRFSEAIDIFDQGAAADLAAKGPDKAAMKYTSIAYANLSKGQNAAAIEAAEKALKISQVVPVRFLAGRILAEAGAIDRARAVAETLVNEVPAEPQSYGKIIQGDIALRTGDARQAVKILNDASVLLDSWLGRFDLGRAYLAAGAPVQADSAFDACVRRRGEALSLLVDEEASYGYFTVVYYYQGRVREEMKNPASADSYREYLKIRGQSKEDPLVPTVRRLAAN